jgi:hypothetical protein
MLGPGNGGELAIGGEDANMPVSPGDGPARMLGVVLVCRRCCLVGLKREEIRVQDRVRSGLLGIDLRKERLSAGSSREMRSIQHLRARERTLSFCRIESSIIVTIHRLPL